MKWCASAVCHVGNCRAENQDNLWFADKMCDPTQNKDWNCQNQTGRLSALFAVCDGMGGAQDGAIAAQLATQAIGLCARQQMDSLSAMMMQANDAICQYNNQNKKNSGSTCVLAKVTDASVQIANIGDSRAYFYTKGQISQVSKDHTEYQRRLKMGFTEADLAQMPQVQHKLTQNLGVSPAALQIEPFYAQPIAWNRGDAILLCSDGLSDLVLPEEMAAILHKWGSTARKVSQLLALALQRGGLDNITIIVIERR